jgi:hypothetical protein
MGGKFSDAMKAAKAVREVDSDSVETEELQQSVNTDIQIVDDSSVSITIKVPRYLREYWQIETRKARTTMTAEVVEFLTNKFGTPD